MNSRVLFFASLAAGAFSPCAHAGTVVLEGSTYMGLLPQNEPVIEAPTDVRIRERRIEARQQGDTLFVSVRWQVDGTTEWFDGRLAGPTLRVEKVLWNGTEAAAHSEPDGVHVAGRIRGMTEIRLEGTIAANIDVAPVRIELLGAAIGSVDLVGTERVPMVAALDGRASVRSGATAWSTGASRFELATSPPKSGVDRSTLAIAHVGMGLTLGDAELRGNARIEWQVRQGALQTVSFAVRGIGTDLEVSGDNVGSWRRAGDDVEVSLRDAKTTRTRIELRWTQAVPAGTEVELGLPTIEPFAWRTESALVLARDGDVEVVPEMSGWEPISVRSLPSYAEGLIAGAPSVAYRRGAAGSGRVHVLRFEPVEQPPVLVDMASYTVAANDEGRVLGRAYLAVRNERASHLRVVPPPGGRLLSVLVGNDVVVPATDSRPGWLVPLPRSVETVDGLLSFPVEIVFLAQEDAWKGTEQRDVSLLALDAPVAVNRVTVHLPPGFASRSREGESGMVGDFTEGETITVGTAVGDVAAADVDAKFQDALDAWMSNDFEVAQERLDDLRDLGVETENVKKLQSNLDVIEGKTQGGDVDETLARRVKDQARVRSLKEEQKQEELLRAADDAYRSGDYDRAGEAYDIALEIGQKLDKLEQSEAVEVDTRNASASAGLMEVEKAKSRKGWASRSGGGGASISDRFVVIDFADLENDGPTAEPSAEKPPPPPLSVVTDIPAPAQPKPAREPITPAAPPPLQVYAASMSVVIPAIGETVRYQHMLLPADAPLEVHVRAKRNVSRR